MNRLHIKEANFIINLNQNNESCKSSKYSHPEFVNGERKSQNRPKLQTKSQKNKITRSVECIANVVINFEQ